MLSRIQRYATGYLYPLSSTNDDVVQVDEAPAQYETKPDVKEQSDLNSLIWIEWFLGK